MIHWSQLEHQMTLKEQRIWRREMCAKSETCDGYSRSEFDDEPCDVCKVCDKLRIEVSE